MTCDWTKENVVLYIYGELADDAKFEYEQHVRHCLGCRRELEQALEFKDAMAAAPVKEVSPSFLALSRNPYTTLHQSPGGAGIYACVPSPKNLGL